MFSNYEIGVRLILIIYRIKEISIKERGINYEQPANDRGDSKERDEHQQSYMSCLCFQED